MKEASQQLHSSFTAPTQLWAYEGVYPGPSIETRAGEEVHVTWENKIRSPMPLTAVIAADPDPGAPAPENQPGLSKKTAPADNLVKDIPAWNVVHLHGANTDADSDGWAENAMLTGQRRLSSYPNRQRSAQLWYHDHAMDITRFNVMTGLAGFWFIRDAFDDAVIDSLVRTRPYRHEVVRPCDVTGETKPADVVEIPILLQDRNFDTDTHDETGQINGALIHKVEDGTREFYSRFNVVNGVVWPKAEVRALPYRLRVLNGANARVYQLRLLDAAGKKVPFQLLGLDGGLLDKPRDSGDHDLVLAPAERADIVIDFAPYAGQTLTWTNFAKAPYQQPNDVYDDPFHTDLSQDRAAPDVMQFVVGPAVAGAKAWVAPSTLSDFKQLDHDQTPHEHQDGLIGLLEEPPMVYLAELQITDKSTPDTIDIEFDPEAPKGQHPLRTWRIDSKRFRDMVDRVSAYDPGKLASDPAAYFEVWRVLNLTPDTHPLHIHLVNFQVVKRETYISKDGDNNVRPVKFSPVPVTPEFQDIGWKDTVRINPNELVTLLLRFDGFTGRYMYHCHLIDHEDQQMMRPYLVAVKKIVGGMGMAMGAGM